MSGRPAPISASDLATPRAGVGAIGRDQMLDVSSAARALAEHKETPPHPHSKTIEIPLALHQRIEAARRSFDESASDILFRMLAAPDLLAVRRDRGRTPIRPHAYIITAFGEDIGSNRLCDTYLRALQTAQARSPLFLENLAKVHFPRGKIVSRDKTELFKTAPHLRQTFARAVGEGYFADCNLSRQQVRSRLRKANAILDHIRAEALCLQT